MEKRTLVCPNCHSRLTVADQPGLENKNLECPKCKFKAKVSVFMTGAASTGGHGADTESTRIVFDAPVRLAPGRFRVAQTNEVFQLRLGSQTIGRRAQAPRADLLIGSSTYSDPYMSRTQAKVEVISVGTGLQHRLYDIGAPNIMQVNGHDVPRGGVIVLHTGDKVTLGQTVLILENSDEEATRVAH